MAKAGLIHVLLCPLLLVALLQSCHGQERQIGELPQGDFSGASTHYSMLGVLGSTSSAKESLIYSYGKSFNGFAAKLTDDEVAEFSDVISVFPHQKLKLHPKRRIPREGDVIIGLLDTGHFSDEGLSPPPSKWKGECQGANFTCNNKIIGARYYNSENSFDSTDHFKSPRDSEGHGTHTSSTAAGREVVGVSYFGLAEGTATGGVLGARIAMYKVCWSFGCSSADILAGFGDAIADGVDVISVSLVSDFPRQYFEDPIAIGSFHAMRKGILTSASTGNSGPFPSTGGGAVNYSIGADTTISKFFFPASTGVSIANGVGTIMANSSIKDFAFSYPLPATVISTKDGLKFLDYIKSTAWKDVMAPYAVSFSSKGPNPITPDIFKPDLIAPRVDILQHILAACSPVTPPSIDSKDTRSVKFNIISGTSISFPHAGGAAVYVKAVHPNWSPVAIILALMTIGQACYISLNLFFSRTTYIVDPEKHEDLEFAYGLGHINPLKAIDLGLTYDHLSNFCTTTMPGRAWSLNYPSFSIAVEDGLPIRAMFSSTITNIGPPNSTYTLSWYMPSSFTVRVEPSLFTVMVYGPNIEQQPITSGAIIWTYGVHVVRSPLVVYTILLGSSFSFSTSLNKPNFKGSSMYRNSGILGGHK
ncbi:hypothetical protein I3843_11G123400 [Carya illinoinensis]|nr:hypothetical protein I3843_11G123400 [Carya illinoinensis]